MRPLGGEEWPGLKRPRRINLFDPAQWGDLLKGKFVMPAVGTNDPLFHLLTDQFYFDDLVARRAFLRVPNYPHGRTTPDHAQGWRFAIAAGLLGRNVPSVRVKVETAEGKATVHATVSGTKQMKSLTLYTATDPTGDYRKAKWAAKETEPLPSIGVSTIVGELDIPADGVCAIFVRVVDDGKYCEGINSSNIVEIGKAVSYSLEQTEANNIW